MEQESIHQQDAKSKRGKDGELHPVFQGSVVRRETYLLQQFSKHTWRRIRDNKVHFLR